VNYWLEDQKISSEEISFFLEFIFYYLNFEKEKEERKFK